MADIYIKPHDFTPGSGGHGAIFEELDPAQKQFIMDGFKVTETLFPGHLGLRLVDIKRGYAKLEVENVKRLCQPAMVMHGGASFGMADTAVAYALISLFGFGHALLTIEMKMTYLEPIPLGLVTAEAYILRATKRNAYAEVDVWAAGKLAARANTTYIIRPGIDVRPAQPPAS